MTQAFPLLWPDAWPRTPEHQRRSDHKFRNGFGPLSLGSVRDDLLAELRRLGAKEIIISTNLRTRLDGLLYADAALHGRDSGAAVYFKLKDRPLVMARDAYNTVAGNLRSLTLAVDAMRTLQRHGGDRMMERAFTGFVAIAPPDWKKPWREVFGVKPDWRGDITALFREKAKHRHSDHGGTDTLMAELNVAYAEAKAEFGV